MKPILRHRDGHSPAPTADAAASAAVESPASDASEPANHFEDSHPKDNVELKHSKETGKSGKAKAGKSVETPTEVAVVEPVVVKEVAFRFGSKPLDTLLFNEVLCCPVLCFHRWLLLLVRKQQQQQHLPLLLPLLLTHLLLLATRNSINLALRRSSSA